MIALKLLLLQFLAVSAPVKTVHVSTQAELDGLDATVRKALAAKPSVLTVRIEPGTYRFRDDHLNLSALDCPETELRIEGDGSVLVGSAPEVKTSPFYRASRLVEVVDADRKLCRIKTGKRLAGPGKLYIQVTAWYRLFTCPVTEIRKGYVYFTCDQLARNGLVYNVNGDFSFGHKLTRFRLMRVQEATEPVSTAFFKVTDCAFRRVSLSGLTFDTNADDRGEYSKDCLIRFYMGRFEEAEVSRCTFRSIRTDVVRIAYSDGVTVKGCRFEDCGRIGVLSYNHSARTVVEDNDFERMGTYGENNPCVRCSGTDYLVQGNRFTDYGCCAVGAGLHFSEMMEHPSSGSIVSNTITQTEAYRKEAPMNLLMDTGAIYVWTQNASLVIRDNVITDISGPCANRGIFCDDGTVNTVIEGNTILRIANSYCIDLRRALSVETRTDSQIRKVNVGNRLGKNKTDGRIRFEQR